MLGFFRDTEHTVVVSHQTDRQIEWQTDGQIDRA